MPTGARTDPRPHGLLVVVCATWGTIPWVVGHVPLSASVIVFARVWIAAPVMALVIALVGRRGSGAGLLAPFRARPGRSLACGVVLAVHWVTQFMAYQRAPSSAAAFVIFLAPVGVALAAPAVLKERAGPSIWIALPVAVAGAALVTRPGLHDPSGAGRAASGLTWAFVSAALLATLTLITKPLAAEFGGLRVCFVQMSVAAVVLLPVAVTSSFAAPASAWGWLAALGLVHTAVCASVYLGVLGRIPVTEVSILGYLEPAGVVVCSWLLLHEAPTWATVTGGLLIVAAGAIVVLGTRARSPLPHVQEGVAA